MGLNWLRRDRWKVAWRVEDVIEPRKKRWQMIPGERDNVVRGFFGGNAQEFKRAA